MRPPYRYSFGLILLAAHRTGGNARSRSNVKGFVRGFDVRSGERLWLFHDGRRRAMLRAYDKSSGEEVGAIALPAPQTGSPMTYRVDGKQYLVLAVSGSGHPGELLAIRLPRVPGVTYRLRAPESAVITV